jgi:hypothetical protein
MSEAQHHQDPDAEETHAISPSTPVQVSMKTAIAMVVSIAALVASAVGSYTALAATDREANSKIGQLEHQLQEHGQQGATKDDLRSLRLEVQMDLLSAVWYCQPQGTSGMTCRPQLRHQQPSQ